MEEEKKQEEIKEEPPKQELGEDMLAQINSAADRLKSENERFEANQKVKEAQRVERMLEGKGENNSTKREETDEEYAQRVLRGDV